MASRINGLLAGVAAIALLGGCTFSDEVLFQSLAGEGPAASSARPPGAQGTSQLGDIPPAIGRRTFQPPAPAPARASGTAVGRTTAKLRVELLRLTRKVGIHDAQLQLLRRALERDAGAYRNIMAPYRSEVSGSTIFPTQRGVPTRSPEYDVRMREARSRLGRVNGTLLKMNGLASKTAVDASTGAQLLYTIRQARTVPGATPEDQRQLAALEQQAIDTVGLVHRMLSATHLEISSFTEYSSVQSQRLAEFRNWVESGGAAPATRQTGRAPATGTPPRAAAPSTTPAPGTAPAPSLTPPARSTRVPATSATPAPTNGTAPAAAAGQGGPWDVPPSVIGGREPLVVIRFANPNVAYEPALFSAVKAALQHRPDLNFDLVSVTPASAGDAGATAGLDHAVHVLRTLKEMGLPTSRVALSAARSTGASHDEVRLFLRGANQAPRYRAKNLLVEPAVYKPTPPRQPLVIIRFNKPRVKYEKRLRKAVQAALDKRPDAKFDLVSMAPRSKGASSRTALRRAAQVMTSLRRMGLPERRVTIAASTNGTATVDEVHVFVTAGAQPAAPPAPQQVSTRPREVASTPVQPIIRVRPGASRTPPRRTEQEARQRLASDARVGGRAATRTPRTLTPPLGSRGTPPRATTPPRAVAPTPAPQIARRPPSARGNVAPARDARGRLPVIVIMFDQSRKIFRPELKKIIGDILRREPKARFNLVSIAPESSIPLSSIRRAEAVIRALADIGVPSNRITISAGTAPNLRFDEVRIFKQ